MAIQTIGILGGSGFVGRYLCYRLADHGYTIRVISRHAHRQQHLQTIPRLRIIEADIHAMPELEAALQGCDAVVNLVGILNDFSGKNSFQQAHEKLAANVVEVCRNLAIGRLLHMSSLHASTAAPSEYLRSKGKAEDLVHTQSGQRLAATSFRPSVIFGPGDSFLNRFAGLLQKVPLFFPLACAEARFQPVFVGDVADAFVTALHDSKTIGKRISLCGPKQYSLKELVQYTADMTGTKRRIIALPDWAAKLQAVVLGIMPGKPFTRDNYNSMQIDSVCETDETCPTSLETIAPTYLGNTGHDDQVQKWRETTRS